MDHCLNPKPVTPGGWLPLWEDRRPAVSSPRTWRCAAGQSFRKRTPRGPSAAATTQKRTGSVATSASRQVRRPGCRVGRLAGRRGHALRSA